MDEHVTLQAIIKLVTNTDTDDEYSIYNKAKTFDEITDLLTKYSNAILMEKEPLDTNISGVKANDIS